MRNCNGYTKFGSDFRCYASFLVCNIRDNTFSDRNTSSLSYNRGVYFNQNAHFYQHINWALYNDQGKLI